MDGWISMSQILVLIYQGLYNHSFMIRSSSDWIHINETSIECGSQSKSWIKISKQKQNKKTHKQIKKKTKKKQNKKKQSKNNYTHCDFPGYSKCGKIILWLFSCDFFSTDATHTYDIILNTDTISILIPYSQW